MSEDVASSAEAGGRVVLLTILAKLKMFGRTIGFLLYVVLAAYVALVGYELVLLRNIPRD